VTVAEAMEKAMSHDEFHNSTQILRRYLRNQQVASLSRHQIDFGVAPIAKESLVRTKRQTATITFKTSATLLRNLFPNDSYMFTTRDTVAYASFRVQKFENVPWLGGRGYHSFGLYVHNVVYKQNDGSSFEGTYVPVMFQDDPESILFGRHDLGLPTLHCSIETQQSKDYMSMKLGWRGTPWGRMELKSLFGGGRTECDTFQDSQLIVHKYVPSSNTQGRLEPDADYAVLLDTGFVHSGDSAERRQCSQVDSSVQFNAYDWNQLPTLHNVVSRLAELPVFEVVSASVENTDGRAGIQETMKIE
jgi:acetoacetate decarboxylase